MAEHQGMKRRVFLHIGHPKTGSSAFQSCLARSHQSLEEQGFLYPYHRSFGRASRLEVSSGNLSIGAEDQNWLNTGVLPVLEHNSHHHTVIFSNENLIHRLSDLTGNPEALPSQWHVHVLLVVRNPIEQLSSVYQQLVKRHGYSQGYEEFLAEHAYRCQATAKAASAVETLEATGISYSLFNYSALKGGVIDALTHTIGIPSELLDRPPAVPVNRSLSASELQLMLVVNALYGRSVGRSLADALVNRLPEIPSIALAMGQQSRENVVAANTGFVNALNSRLPSDAQLSLSNQPGFSGDLHCDFDAHQLQLTREILAGALSQETAWADRDRALVAPRDLSRRWRRLTQRLMTAVSRLQQAQGPVQSAPGSGRRRGRS